MIDWQNKENNARIEDVKLNQVENNKVKLNNKVKNNNKIINSQHNNKNQQNQEEN